MRLRVAATRALASLLVLGLILTAWPTFGIVHAQCTGDDTTVECTGIDPDGYRPVSGSDPSPALSLTVHDGALVQDHILVNDNDTVLIEAGGTVTATQDWQATGVGGYGSDISVTNNGTVTATAHAVIDGQADGINLTGENPEVTNTGAITAVSSGELGYSHGIAFNARDTGVVTNTGSITSATTNGDLASGIHANGDVQITNSGTITASSTETLANGIAVLDGTGAQVTNSGTIDVDGARYSSGIVIYGDGGQITNSGTVNARDAAIWTGDGNQSVTNSGTLNGNVLLNGGNDSFTAEGGAVNGLLDGGADFDTLTFAFDVLDVDYPALAAQIADASPAGGSLFYGGATYTWVDFEQLIDLLNIVASNGGGKVVVSTGGIADGRLNSQHPAATAIVYRLEAGGVELYTPQGEWVFDAEADAVFAALAEAAASGAPVEIDARLGLALYALPDGTLFATGPGYSFAFQPYQCGIDL